MPNGTPLPMPNADENSGKFRPDSVVLPREFEMVADIDQDVIEGCQRGDEAAFRDLFESHKDKVYSIALRFSGDAGAAMDITQDTFLKLMDRIGQFRGLPKAIRTDQGPEFTSRALDRWAYGLGIDLKLIAAGKPTQNAYVERFNKTYRTEVLDCYVFDSLQEVRQMTEDWLHRYNHHRPHESLGRIPPVEYRVKQFPNLYF